MQLFEKTVGHTDVPDSSCKRCFRWESVSQRIIGVIHQTLLAQTPLLKVICSKIRKFDYVWRRVCLNPLV